MSTDQQLLKELKEATLAAVEEPKQDITLEGTETSGVDEVVPEAEEAQNEPEYTEIEKQALEQGWNPKFSGPTAKTAEQFVRDGSFFKKIDAQKKEILELKEAFQNMTSHQKKLEKASYERAKAELQAERRAAIEIGDVDTVEHLDLRLDHTKEQLKALDQQPQVVAPVQNTPDPAAFEFKEKNKSWFNVDLLNKNQADLKGEELQNYKMTKAAFTYDDYLGMKIKSGELNYTPAQALQAVEEFIKDTYADRFSNENPNKESAPAVGRSTTGSTASSPTSKLTAKLSDHQKNVYKMYLRADPKFGTLEEYAKQLQDIGDLK
jgi:hypothetical protein